MAPPGSSTLAGDAGQSSRTLATGGFHGSGSVSQSERLDRLDNTNTQIAETLKKLLESQQKLTEAHEKQLQVLEKLVPVQATGTINEWMRYLRTALLIFCEIVVVVIGAFTIYYAVKGLQKADQAIAIGSNWAKVSYDNEVRGLWMQAQDLCSQNMTSFPISKERYVEWTEKGRDCKQDMCVCDIVRTSEYIGGLLLDTYYPYVNGYEKSPLI